jgi:hypothetical protein
MPDSIEDRAREFLEREGVGWATEPEYGIQIEDLNRRPERRRDQLVRFASAEREAACRELLSRADAASDMNEDLGAWTAMGFAFEAVFGKKLEEGE